MIEANIFEASHRAGVEKLLFLGLICIYPKFAEQPIVEDALLTGRLEPTNEWYAIAKIAGIKLAQAYRQQHGRDFICAMPTNLYGPGDNFDLASSHVMPRLIRKAHEAKQHEEREIVVWGTGTPRREFLHVDDCADACVHLMKTYSEAGHVNVGAGQDVTILELTKLVCEIVGFSGEITHDHSKPDGTPRKLISIDKIRALGWSPQSRTSLRHRINIFLVSESSQPTLAPVGATVAAKADGTEVTDDRWNLLAVAKQPCGSSAGAPSLAALALKRFGSRSIRIAAAAGDSCVGSGIRP